MGMTIITFAVAATCYVVATALFFAHLFRGGETQARLASASMTLAAIAQSGFVAALLWVEHHPVFASIDETLAVGSLLVAIAYLATMRRHRLTVLGAFIAPVCLLMLMGAGVDARVARVPHEVRNALLPLHIGVNILGIVAFALAFAVSLAYMIQEQRLRTRKLSGIFKRLPALDVLDSLGLRLITIGFPLFTVGMLTGSVWAIRSGHGAVTFSPGQGFAVLSWLFFGVVLLSRAAAGWRGRRAAVGTVLGFLCAMAALVGYAVRGLGTS